ncbi:uncharacterized protein F5891DRAFT_986523 [Suillus fuscotomentosus]|uniref:Uncharacterized protein n=1 Tax=Suillus fuscotomentosus TaxID=1912939 RepID=A0AAD4HDM8_9AGAM|nr:uncharacterized protein F5891DRAFT_986523 [Suillus fuscotomentosus]KAG1891822.1 hypothetical protein F5891DRAFT_986523 [Suillus fuscotomentosus]
MPPLNTPGLADIKQLELQELKDINKELTEENKILKANQPKCKKKGQNVSEESMAFDEEIHLCGRKYGACYEMFVPDRQLLQHPNPTFPPPLNELSHYEMLASLACRAIWSTSITHPVPQSLNAMQLFLWSSIYYKLIRL